jgi:predicted SprT family Zn-dependent metalloprotease
VAAPLAPARVECPLPNDRVSFPLRRGRVLGTVVATSLKTATVRLDCGELYRVPWDMLAAEQGSTGNGRREAIMARAIKLLARHSLRGWTFAFDAAKRRGGACHFGKRRITMAAGFAVAADEAEIEDTLLHEIAHALVGPRHQHDAVWQAKAREIGCSARRCHAVAFSEPSLIARCVKGCFAIGRHRSRRNMRCRQCGGAVVYTPAAGA